MKSSLLKKVSFMLLVLFLAFLACEGVFRLMIFSHVSYFQKLRNPGLYVDYFSEDDYWKLHYLFSSQPVYPKTPHPLLGWSGDFSSETLRHNQERLVKNKRPVLLYGDSFSGCHPSELCFQDILNKSPDFSENHALLNYGVGNYGLDQIYLLLKNTVELYDNPFVVVGLMTFDLDRSILSVRIGQKRKISLKKEKLSISDIPVDESAKNYFETNPPTIKSYFYRFLIFNEYMPKKIGDFLKGKRKWVEKKKKLNEKLLQEIANELSSRNIDFIFLVFHPHWEGVSSIYEEDDWRDPFLRNFFEKNNIPFIWAKDVFMKDSKYKKPLYPDYLIPGNNHPTTYFNQLLSNEIKKLVLKKKKP